MGVTRGLSVGQVTSPDASACLLPTPRNVKQRPFQLPGNAGRLTHHCQPE